MGKGKKKEPIHLGLTLPNLNMVKTKFLYI